MHTTSKRSTRRTPVHALIVITLAVTACASEEPTADPTTSVTTDPTTDPTTEPSATSTSPATTSPIDSTTATSTTAAPVQTPDDTADDVVEVQVASETIPIALIANEDAPPLPNGAIERSIEHEGHEIFTVEIPGAGPPIMLLHGFPDHLSLYDEVFPLLAGRRVIAFDFIGWGRSAKPAPGEEYEYTTRAQAAELSAVIDAYELSDITLVVHDQSAPVGLEYLLDDDALVAELVFLQGFFMASPNLSPPKGIELHADDRLQAAERALQLDPAAVEAYHRFQMDEFIVAAPNEQEMIDRLWALFPEARPAFMALTDILIDEVIDRTGRVDQLRELTTPIDIVYGELDPYLTPALAAEFDAIFPNSTLTIVPDAGHFVQIDAPQVVADAILVRNT